jgi:CelD/BcsL family acetyltransferase involved in cellulose biosynthesis
MSDYNTFLLTEKKFEHVRMLIKFATERISNWDSIEFSEVPENSNTAELLAMLKTKPSFTARIRNICPYIPLPNQLEDYLIKLDGRFRRELRRCEKNLGRGNKVSFRTCNKMTDVESDMRTFFDLHEKRWNSRKMPGALPSKKLHDFHQNVAQLLAEKGWLNLSFTMVNDLPVASVYGFTYGQKLYAYLSGFDPSYAQYSVADLHWRYLVEHCIKSNLLELDFMRGAESYKKKWNTKARRNLEFWTAKKRVVPIFYNLITKNDNFASIRARIGPRLVKYFS